MFIERLVLTNFRCFGSQSCTIDLSPGLTAFVGVNGAGKTCVMQALQRLFGVSDTQRRVRRQDFHIPLAEGEPPPRQRSLSVEAILAFPELDADDADDGAVPEFFHQMAAEEGGKLKCRLRLDATWAEDGSLEGAIEQRICAVRKLGTFEESDRNDLKAMDRSRIQMIYVPGDGLGTTLRNSLEQKLARAEAENWTLRSFNRHPACPESELAGVFLKGTTLSDQYLHAVPSGEVLASCLV